MARKVFYSTAITAKAKQLHEAHNMSKPEASRAAFDTLSAKLKEPWLQAAKKILSETL